LNSTAANQRRRSHAGRVQGQRVGGHHLRAQLLLHVHASVPLPLVAAREALPAHIAGEGLLPGVRARVRGQVVAAAEAARADGALEGLLSRVDAHVPVELVGAREAALAALHAARERLQLRAAPRGSSPAPARRLRSARRVHVADVDYRERALQEGGEQVRVQGGGEGGGGEERAAPALHELRLHYRPADDVAAGVPPGARGRQALQPVLQPQRLLLHLAAGLQLALPGLGAQQRVDELRHIHLLLQSGQREERVAGQEQSVIPGH
ncbi:uncharacterized protein, partial [Pagrus major]|uniref:uncharacterized protein n=1 Tax=Pagrus major TaxID=143350 RepID=UPI003CC8D702